MIIFVRIIIFNTLNAWIIFIFLLFSLNSFIIIYRNNIFCTSSCSLSFKFISILIRLISLCFWLLLFIFFLWKPLLLKWVTFFFLRFLIIIFSLSWLGFSWIFNMNTLLIHLNIMLIKAIDICNTLLLQIHLVRRNFLYQT